MPIDMSWRPARRGLSKKRKRWRWGLLAVLVGANIAVVAYHGDPRQNLPPQGQSSARPAAGSVRPGLTSNAGGGEVQGSSGSTERPQRQGQSPGGGGKEQGGAARGPQSSLLDGWLGGATTLARRWSVGGGAAPGSWSRRTGDFDPTAGLRAPGLVQRVEVAQLRAGQTPATLLAEAGAQGDDIGGALGALQAHVDFRRLKPGDTVTMRFAEPRQLVSVEVHRGAVERGRADRAGQEAPWQGRRLAVSLETVTTVVSGEVHSSLWDALLRSGESPALVAAMVDIFAWEIDFYTEIQVGDKFRLLVEKRFVDGEFADYGAVLAAEMVTGGTAHRAFLHRLADGSGQYYDERGESVRRAMLKSPLKYANVTSRFGLRRHPILGYTRKHNGIDYGVPTGTPVWAVADGQVLRAGWHGGYGQWVELRHSNGYVSEYAHLSKIHVRPGQRVQQKQVIGLVGSTGLSTGPHLHYGLQRHGVFINPGVQRFERAPALLGQELLSFKQRAHTLLVELERVSVAQEAQAKEPQES